MLTAIRRARARTGSQRRVRGQPGVHEAQCAASCNSCDWLDYKKRCPMPADRVPAVQAGDISITFERALSEYQSLGPKVLSRDPWVMSFDNFLSDEEVEAVVKHGEGRFERSTASGGRKDDEFIPLKSDIRTSWTTWCDTSACLEDPIVKRIYNRVSNVTRVPADNFEYMQLLLPAVPTRRPSRLPILPPPP